MFKRVILLVYVLLFYFVSCNDKTPALADIITITINNGNTYNNILLKNNDANPLFSFTDTLTINPEDNSYYINRELVSGMYTINVPSTDISIDFLISDNQPKTFAINYINNELSFSGSEENEVFLSFQQYLADQIAVRDVLPGISSEDNKQFMLAKFNKQLWSEVDSIKGELPESNVALYAELAAQILSEDVDLSAINFKNKAIASIPLTESLFYQYFFLTLNPLDTETIISQTDNFLNKSVSDRQIKSSLVIILYDLFINSPLPGHDVIATHIANTYILTDQRASLYTNDYSEQVASNISYLNANPIGSQAPDLKLKTISGQYVTLHNVKSDYTILLFYDPFCTTCDKVLEQLEALYKTYAAKGLKVFAVYTQDDSYSWKKTISSNPTMGLWTNVEMAPDREDVLTKYPIAALPSIYILDKNKSIIDKNITANDLTQKVQELFVK